MNAQPSLHINEILASNATVIYDEKNEFDDWVEIYNGGKDTVSLSGMYLTNDLQKTKWRFPDDKKHVTSIPP
ncbi:MAG TPA: hypothetical protein VNJ07_07815, partial [Chitinophagales bacterium]|nr:hypothetical protein [Chitinophagales bacterium]